MASPTPSSFIEIWPTKREASIAAAKSAARILREALAARGAARLLLATGNSQIDLIDQLVIEPGIAWPQVEVFHLDEYAGIDANHPASFRRWARERFARRVQPGAMHYIEGDAADLRGVLCDYRTRLAGKNLDLALIGVGENSHIAFNDPGVADFDDPQTIKLVTLDEACRRQQVNEGHFPTLEAVPTQALTITCSGLFRAAHWICCVPEKRKARAVREALEGPVTAQCPASLVQRHPSAAIFLDQDSAALLSADFVARRCRRPSAG